MGDGRETETLFLNCQTSSHEDEPRDGILGRDASPHKHTLNLD